MPRTFLAALLAAACWPALQPIEAEDWPRFRGPNGSAVSDASPLPATWSAAENVRWSVELPGEGASSPILCRRRLFLTVAFDAGARRALLCLDRGTGRTLWKYEIDDTWPEITSALTGYAAPTPATDGTHVVAFFGSAGALCCDLEGRLLWRKDLGDFESELGIASSPIIHQDSVILVCDHDGDRFNSFDSYIIALDVRTGQTRWKTERGGLRRSWSTPIMVPAAQRQEKDSPGAPAADELVVAAQDELRGYDPATGAELWKVRGLTGWVAPAPVFGQGMIFAASGKDGPTLAVLPGGRGDVTDTHVVWSERRGAPYVSSPVLYREHLYVANELGVVTCRKAATGEIVWQRRLGGKFFASPVAGDGKIYLPAQSGEIYVLQAGPKFSQLAVNPMKEELLASPVPADGCLYLRTQRRLYCIE
jgi:outer membrane protein assembly factor BamB